jgi:voltage-gated potassium channel
MTVAYGDVSPVTLEGRLIAVVLMLTGIGVFTATVASLFFEQDRSELAELHARLDAIERKLDAPLVDCNGHLESTQAIRLVGSA